MEEREDWALSCTTLTNRTIPQIGGQHSEGIRSRLPPHGATPTHPNRLWKCNAEPTGHEPRRTRRRTPQRFLHHARDDGVFLCHQNSERSVHVTSPPRIVRAHDLLPSPALVLHYICISRRDI